MYLRATRYLDHDQEIVRTYADKVCSGAGNDRERAVALFYAVRDDIRYDPFSCTLDADSLRASHVLNEGRSYCVGKAVLLAAVGGAGDAQIGWGERISARRMAGWACLPKLPGRARCAERRNPRD